MHEHAAWRLKGKTKSTIECKTRLFVEDPKNKLPDKTRSKKEMSDKTNLKNSQKKPGAPGDPCICSHRRGTGDVEWQDEPCEGKKEPGRGGRGGGGRGLEGM